MKIRIFLILLLALFISPIYLVSANEGESYFTEQAAKITQDKFHRERLVDASNFYTDGSLIASYNSDTANISIFSKGNKTLSLVNEYNLFELGLNPNNTHIRTIQVLNNAIYMIVNEYGENRTDINIRKVTFDENKVHTSPPLYTLPESFETAVNNNLVLTKSANADSLVVVMYEDIFETELIVISVDGENGELSKQDIVPVDSRIIHASINTSGILVVIPYNGDIETYTQNDLGEFSLAHSYMNDDLPRRELPENIMLNPESGHMSLGDSSQFMIIKITEAAKVEVVLSVASEDIFEGTPLSYKALQSDSFVIAGNLGGRSGEARLFSYSDDGSYKFQSTFHFATLDDAYADPTLSYLDSNEMLIREGRQDNKSAYGVLSFNDSFNVTYKRFLEKEYANSEIPWNIHYTKIVANNRLLLISGYDARLLDISSANNFKDLKHIKTSLPWSNRYIKEVDNNTFLIVGIYKYQVLFYDEKNESFSISEAESYVDSEGGTIVLQGDYMNRVYGDWYNSKFMAYTHSNQLGIFSFNNNRLTFEHFLKDNPEENFITSGIKSIKAFGSAIHLVNTETRYIYSLRLLNDVWTVVSKYYVEGSNSMADEAFVVGDKLLLADRLGNDIHTFKVEGDELKLIVKTPGIKGLQDVAILDDRHFITYDNEVKEAKLLKLDDSGKVTQLYSLPSDELAKEKGGYYSLGLSSYQYSFYMDGQNLWYLLDRHMLGRLQLNRAPVWLNSNNISINVNQGVEKNFLLSNFIFDFDLNSELSFNHQSMPSGFSLTDQNELSYNGTELDEKPLIVEASDSELSAVFTFSTNFNYAPQLIPNYTIETIQKKQPININIVGLFSDPEGNVFTLTMEDKSGLSLNDNGVLTGSLTDVGNHVVVIRAVDEHGAVSTSNLTIKVEGKAVTAAEKSSSGGGMGHLLILFLLVLRSKAIKK